MNTGLFTLLLIIHLVNRCSADKSVLLTPDEGHHHPGRVLYYRPTAEDTPTQVPWEEPLKQTSFLTLSTNIKQLLSKYTDGVTEESRNDDNHYGGIYNASYIGKMEDIPRFGDITVLARGKLLQDRHGFKFLQDPYNNDCDECHNERTFLKDNKRKFENITALWSVKRIRHRDAERGHRYELKITISPINEKTVHNLDYTIPGQSFIVKDDDYPKYFQANTQNSYKLQDRFGKNVDVRSTTERMYNINPYNNYYVDSQKPQRFYPPELNTNEYYTTKYQENPKHFNPAILIQTNPDGFHQVVHDLRPNNHYNRVRFPLNSEPQAVPTGVAQNFGTTGSYNIGYFTTEKENKNHLTTQQNVNNKLKEKPTITHLHHHHYYLNKPPIKYESYDPKYIEVYKDSFTQNPRPLTTGYEVKETPSEHPNMDENTQRYPITQIPEYIPTEIFQIPVIIRENLATQNPQSTLPNPTIQYYQNPSATYSANYKNNVRSKYVSGPSQETSTAFIPSPEYAIKKYSEPDPLYHQKNQAIQQFFIPNTTTETESTPFAVYVTTAPENLEETSHTESAVEEQNINIQPTIQSTIEIEPTKPMQVTDSENHDKKFSETHDSTSEDSYFTSPSSNNVEITEFNHMIRTKNVTNLLPDSINAQLPAPEKGADTTVPYVSANTVTPTVIPTESNEKTKILRAKYTRPKNLQKPKWMPRRFKPRTKNYSTTSPTTYKNKLLDNGTDISESVQHTVTSENDTTINQNVTTPVTFAEITSDNISAKLLLATSTSTTQSSFDQNDVSVEPLTSQSYITSISFEVGKKNKSTNTTGDMYKAKIYEVFNNQSDFHVYKAESDINSNNNVTEPDKNDENASTEKKFDDIAMRLINHARKASFLSKNKHLKDKDSE